MRVAVVGASGFVGRHVLAELAARGVETIATSRSGAVVHAAPSQTTRALDLTTAGIDPWIRLGRPDVVIHLAWGGLPNYRALHHHETELPAQYAFLSALVRGGLRRLFVVGTCLEYGLRDGALDEAMAPDPTTPYGFAKDALRRQLAFLQRETSFALTWGRAFYLYGEGQAPGSLLSQLRAAVEAGRPSFPMSGGEQLRDFLPVAEAARLVVELSAARPRPRRRQPLLGPADLGAQPRRARPRRERLAHRSRPGVATPTRTTSPSPSGAAARRSNRLLAAP